MILFLFYEWYERWAKSLTFGHAEISKSTFHYSKHLTDWYKHGKYW